MLSGIIYYCQRSCLNLCTNIEEKYYNGFLRTFTFLNYLIMCEFVRKVMDNVKNICEKVMDKKKIMLKKIDWQIYKPKMITIDLD